MRCCYVSWSHARRRCRRCKGYRDSSGTSSQPDATTVGTVTPGASITIDHAGDYKWTIPIPADQQAVSGFAAETRVNGVAEVTNLTGRPVDAAGGGLEYQLTFTVRSFSPGASLDILNISSTQGVGGQ